MKVNIWIKREIDIPDDELLGLAKNIRQQWGTPATDPVHLEDLVLHARKEGLISASLLEDSDDFKTDDETFTDDDLFEITGTKRKAKKKR